jgi:FAD binding domain/Berberine and berberine like
MENRSRRDFINSALAAGTALSIASCHGLSYESRAPIRSEAIRTFSARLKGRVLTPTDSDYDGLIRLYFANPRTQRQPVLVVQCAHTDDVRRSIEFARRTGLEIAVRGGGHSHVGWSSTGGLLIDMSSMKRIHIDRAARVGRFEGGVLSGEAIQATAMHGLAPVLGECPGVGVTGLILGGGLGWLSGLYGAACDNLLSAQTITADSTLESADAQKNTDLFWALRGAGANFGVTTTLECRLHPVDIVTAGELHYDVGSVRPLTRVFAEAMAQAPDSFQAALNLSRGQRGVFLNVCHAGEVGEADRLLRSFRTVSAPIRDTVVRQRFMQFAAPPPAAATGTGAGSVFRCVQALYVERLSSEFIDRLLERFDHSPPEALMGIDHYMHGRLCQPSSSSTAFPHREQGGSHLRIGVTWEDPAQATHLMAWADESWRVLRPVSGERLYANYQTYEREGSPQAVYGVNHSRLVTIKGKYDPTNAFHRNSNILPTTG